QVVSQPRLAESGVCRGRDLDNRRRERIHAIAAVSQRHADGIEAPAGKRPRAVIHQAPFSVVQDLAAGAHGDRAFFDIADVNVTLPQIKKIIEGARARRILAKGARVLTLQVEPEPRGGTYRYSDAQAVEKIRVRAVGRENFSGQSLFQPGPVFAVK